GHHRQEVPMQRGDHGPGQEVSGERDPGQAVVRLDLAEHELTLLLAAVAGDLLGQQRHVDRRGVHAGSDVLDPHDARAWTADRQLSTICNSASPAVPYLAPVSCRQLTKPSGGTAVPDSSDSMTALRRRVAERQATSLPHLIV